MKNPKISIEHGLISNINNSLSENYIRFFEYDSIICDTDDEKIIEQIENDKIVVFKIDISKLNQSHLHNDKNIILEEGEKPYSFEYTENISPDYLQICEKED